MTNQTTKPIVLTEKQTKLLSFYIGELERYLTTEETTTKRGRGGNQNEKSKQDQWLETLKTISNKLREDYIKELEEIE